MSFCNLKPKIHSSRKDVSPLDSYKINKVNPLKNSELSKALAVAVESEVVLPGGRGPEFRPSSFPSCPILSWMKLYRNNALGYKEKHLYFGMQYYTSVGTAVHEKIQYFMGFTGKVWGHWKCINHMCDEALKAADTYDALGHIIKEGKPTRRCTTNNKCPKCKQPMAYIEFTIKYKGVTGHIDGIFKCDNGKWIIFDYKTTSLKKVVGQTLPEAKHLMQLPFYTYVMEKKYAKKYGMKIDSFSLVYMPRDNPFQYYEYAEKWTDKWRHRMKNLYKREKRHWDAIKQDLEDDTFTNVISEKPCSCRSDYSSKMKGVGECIMSDVCFSPSKLKNKLSAWKKVHKSDSIPTRIPFEQVITLISNTELKRKKEEVKKISI